jgi:prevent-host-death family protein
MAKTTIHEAKTHLSRLLRRVEMGEEIVVYRGNEPVARIVPIQKSRKRALGLDRGRFVVPDDFDDPLPDEILHEF